MDAITTIIDTEAENPYATFPSVPRTASINGFADRIYDQLPECAKACMFENTGSTPCPYWDTGCLCVMPQFGGAIGQCVADNCQGDAIGSVEYLATSICSSAGVWDPYWFIPESVSEALASAAAIVIDAETATATTDEEAAATTEAQEGPSIDVATSQPTETDAPDENQVDEENMEKTESEEGVGEETEGTGEKGDGSTEEGAEEGNGEEQSGAEGTKEEQGDDGEQIEEEQSGEKEEEKNNDSNESVTKEEGEITETPEEWEGDANQNGEPKTQEEYSTSTDTGNNSVDAGAEAASIASELENGAVAQGSAFGGIIVVLAALI